MKAVISICFVLLSGLYVNGQDDIKKYISESSIAINTIEPDATDYTDLAPIGEAIGDARIVMLGEQDHGDAPTFLAKTRLIKYLHEQKGFNVLAFESDFGVLNHGYKKIAGKSEIDSLIDKSVTPSWTHCVSCQPLFREYIPNQYDAGSPLIITGFDNQMHISIVGNLDSVVRSEKLPITLRTNYNEEISPQLKAGCMYVQGSEEQNNHCKDYLISIKKELLEIPNADEFWVRVVDNMLSLYKMYSLEKNDYYGITNARDSQMAVNLEWIAKVKYPDQKIIVWAHNHHISKYSGHYPVTFFNEAKTMGTVFTKMGDNEKDTYIIGFTSYQGTYGRLYPSRPHQKIPRPKPQSFENWIPKAYQYAYVDFRKFNIEYPMWNRNFNLSGAIVNNRYHQNYEAQWNRVFDGVFFIRDMYPCEPIVK